MPATIGAFSVCFGKLMHHPDTRNLPFSYLIAYGDTMYLSPGRNITTVGLYRDIRKWPKRDMRPAGAQLSIVNFDWLSPFTVEEIVKGKKILEDLRKASGGNVFNIVRPGAVRQAHGGDGIAVQPADQPGVGAARRGVQQGAENRDNMAVRRGETVEMEGHIAAADHAQTGGIPLDEAELPEGVLPRAVPADWRSQRNLKGVLAVQVASCPAVAVSAR